MARFRTSRIFDVIFLLLVGAVLLFAFTHKIQVSDWIFSFQHPPSTRAQQVAADAGLSPYGAKLLYRTNPQFVNQQTLDVHCNAEKLGCIDEKGIVFILDDPDNYDQTVVTAAHEMLHLAYRRLDPKNKAELDMLLDKAMADNVYALEDGLRNQDTLEERRDEAHSLLGTQFRYISAELESYYAQYFSDRSKTLDAYERSSRL